VTSSSFKKPTVLIFKETLLPVSETFIAAQAGHLTQFTPRYVGLGRVSPSLPLPDDSILLTNNISSRSALRQKLYRRAGIAPAFHRRVEEADAKLIHAHFASGGRSALPLARRLRIPLVVTLHGSDVTTRVNFRRRYEELWKQSSTFICVSNFILNKAVEAGFPPEKLVKLFIGVDRDIFRPVATKRDPDLVVFVGRLVEKKGCAYLLQAMAQVQQHNSNARTVVIGDGPLRSSLGALARKLNLSCEFLGSQPSTAVREWMSRARVFCAPSVTAANGDSEGLGMVFAEAQAMGTPVTTFNHAGMREIVFHEETGLLAPERDANELGSNISRLLNDDALWSRLSRGSVAVVADRFDLSAQTFRLEQLYVEMCRSTKSVHPESWAVNRFASASTAPEPWTQRT
jgi:colanic acid/amylovoran biosynthesis glycosyltransferase